MTTFHIIAYPQGKRVEVGTHHAREAIDIFPVAAIHARMRGEYVDVEAEGRQVAVCDGAGPSHGYGEFRYS